jgi:hypothetical protein
VEVARRQATHASSFLEMEYPISSAAHMADLVAALIAEAHDKGQADEQTIWVVMHLCEMIGGLRDLYCRLDKASDD